MLKKVSLRLSRVEAGHPGVPRLVQVTGGRPRAPAAEEVRQLLEGKPLADTMRPDALQDFVGQGRAVGPETLLRSLLEASEVPSLILWGPPGCGKVSAPSRPSAGGDGGFRSGPRGVPPRPHPLAVSSLILWEKTGGLEQFPIQECVHSVLEKKKCKKF